MSSIHKLINDLRGRSDLSVKDQEEAWLICIPKGGDSHCEITVPHEVLEWFASVKRCEDKKEVWSDWMDYCGYADSPKEMLEALMADHIAAFVGRVTTSELRLPLHIYEEKA